jgi:hypothetical protein
MSTELAINAIDVYFERICSHCGCYCNENGACPSEACRTLTALGYIADDTLHDMINSQGWSDAVMERMSINLRNAKKNNPELFV